MKLGLAAVLAAALVAHAGTAWAEAESIAKARVAIGEADFENAQRMLMAAIQAGHLELEDVRTAYQLLARNAAALGQAEIAEQYYKRWLVVDPGATLPADASPKLREPFNAAKDWATAHGALTGKASIRGTTVIVMVSADPLGMAKSARVAGGEPVALDAELRAKLVLSDGKDVSILDAHGNTLVVITPTAATGEEPTPTGPTEMRASHRYLAFGIPAVVFIGGAVVTGILANSEWGKANDAIDDSPNNFFSDADDHATRARYFTIGSIAAGAVGVGLGIAAVVSFSNRHETVVVPHASDDGAGVSLIGRF